MKKITFVWSKDYGLHARPAGMLASIASKFESAVSVTKESKSASAKGLFSLMGLGIKAGDEVSIEIEGSDSEKACEEICCFLKNDFVSDVNISDVAPESMNIDV